MTVLTIRRKLGGFVVGIGGAVVVRQVAAHAGVWRIVVITVMTGRTVIGNSRMRPVEYIEYIVVKTSRQPGGLCMTALTVRRELSSFVVGVGGSVVIRQVAAHAGVGRIVVITVVAGHTVIGNSRMRAIERIVVVVVGKSRRCPAGLGGVAARTVIAEAQRHVVGVAGLVKIRAVATRTGVRGVVIVPVMTGCAVVGDQRMASCQGIKIIVVESRGRPGRLRMTTRTVGRELSRFMVRIYRLVKIRQVTTHTGRGRIIVITVVTGRTVIGNGRMCAVESVVVVVIIKTRRRPATSRSVTAYTIRAVVEGHMIRIVSLHEGRTVAVCTVGRCPRKPRGVALHTICPQMCSCERESSRIVVKNQVSITRRVTGQTSSIIVNIAIHILMILIGLRIGVTAHTGKLRVVVGVGMAVRTLIPFTLVRSAIDREILTVMVKISRCPGSLAVTARAGSRKSGCCVVRIRCPVIIRLMAAHTGIGCIVVITVVTGRAVIGNGRVRAIERIVIVMAGKSRRRPADSRRMATRTVIAEA